MKRKVSKCKRENSDSNIGGNESTDKEVFEPMASKKKDKSFYKCSHCILSYTTVDGLMKHLLTHQEHVRSPKSSGIHKTKELKTKEKHLPICKIILTRCENLISSYLPIGAINNVATNIQNGENIARKTLPRSDILKPGKANSVIERSSSRKFALKQTEIRMKSHKCQLCSKSYVYLGDLKDHIRSHTGERPFRCQLCSKSFARQGVLKRHIQSHTGERPYKCQLCSKSFARQGHPKTHIQSHTGERPLRCQLCSKSFAQQGVLNRHIQSHTGERPHKCQLCSKSFARQGHLKTHIQSHTGERPHRCQLCSKSFGQQGSLKLHIRTHTGERPFPCQLCSKSFARQGDLKTHIRTHTRKLSQ